MSYPKGFETGLRFGALADMVASVWVILHVVWGPAEPRMMFWVCAGYVAGSTFAEAAMFLAGIKGPVNQS